MDRTMRAPKMPQEMDNLTYAYNTSSGKLVNNRLRHVKDAIGNANYQEDIDNQPDDNYGYDAIGNLTKDVKEGITNITWSVYGKILSISKATVTIYYTYDAGGNRISKKVTEGGSVRTAWYVRDASGNVMAVYEQRSDLNSNHLTQSEVHLYGSSRLGVMNINRDLVNPPSGEITKFERGIKFFELSNHLGNVLVTVSDRKLQVADANNSQLVAYYNADVVTATDYYPFGMDMPGRKYGQAARYGFNGKERDKDMHSLTAYDYGFRIYNPAIGKFLSVDPLTVKYPWNSPYSYAEGDPMNYIDIDGAEQNARPAQSTTIPTIPRTTPTNNVQVDPNLLNGRSGGSALPRSNTQLINGPINSGAYSSQTQNGLVRMTNEEIYALIPPRAGASLSADGKSLEISTANGRYSVSIYKKLEPKTDTWLDRALAKIRLEQWEQQNKPFNYESWNQQRGFMERYTDDASNLSDEYLEEVRKRIEGGNPTAQDMLYAKEVQKRKTDCRIGMIYENPGAHDPKMQNFDKTKSVLPANHKELFDQSVLVGDTRWTKVGKGKKAVYHRFQNSGNNTWHWNGSTDGKRKDGTSNKISENNVPNEIKKLNE